MGYIFSSEAVAAGHPDKVCDQISDLIVDMYLSKDPNARLGVETLATTNRVIVAGEIKSNVHIDPKILEENIRSLVTEIGYVNQIGFNSNDLEFECLLHEQSPDIAMGVDETAIHAQGAGDQGIMFGYATNETNTYMPAPLYYSNRLLQKLHELRVNKYQNILGPDAKAQLSIIYEDDQPIGVAKILVSTQASQDTSVDDLKPIVEQAVQAVMPTKWLENFPDLLINPTGRFVLGGPCYDTGLTGRKIIVDTYGGAAPHGGGAFSGKDPSKVDRSAAYMLRYLAKNIVAAGLSEKCTMQLAYAIGMAEPLSVYINTHGSGRIDKEIILEWIKDNVDLTPKGIRQHLGLNKPIYLRTASYGHFGRTPQEDGGFAWEKLDLVPLLQKL